MDRGAEWEDNNWAFNICQSGRMSMSDESLSPTRRTLIATSAAVAALSLLPAQMGAAADALAQPSKQGAPQMATKTDAIRPFSIDFPEESLVDLRRRVAATKWPERETVADSTQGVQLATMQALARYWGADYDWRKVEARLNALPQFITEV